MILIPNVSFSSRWPSVFGTKYCKSPGGVREVLFHFPSIWGELSALTPEKSKQNLFTCIHIASYECSSLQHWRCVLRFFTTEAASAMVLALFSLLYVTCTTPRTSSRIITEVMKWRLVMWWYNPLASIDHFLGLIASVFSIFQKPEMVAWLCKQYVSHI